jgi:signal transduction histidine kinase
MPDETFPLRTLLRAFPGIPVEEARVLIRSGVVRSYPEGAALCVEDEPGSTFYIVMDGKVKVTKNVDPAGKVVRLLKTLGPGDFFGEMALIQDAPRAASVTAETPTSVLEIYKEDFDELLSASPSLSRALMREVVNRLRANDAMAIEDLRMKANELAGAYQSLAEQEYARREFLHTVAGELRAPLAAAGDFLHLLKQDSIEGKASESEALRAASRHLEQIISLVNDILFVQEMDVGALRFETVRIGELVQAAIAASRERLEANDVRIEAEIPANLPPLSGHPAALRRALDAVIDNAIQFSRPGETVHICIGSENDRVWAEVRDRGAGIDPEDLSHIFERFYRANSLNRASGGAGLGLAIARQVVELHNGKINVDSRPGEGTVVRIDLPAKLSG